MSDIMNKHSNHIDYICEAHRNSMGWYALGYFSGLSIHWDLKWRLEHLLCRWHNYADFAVNSQPHAVTGRAEKYRLVALHLLERDCPAKYKRVLSCLKKNDACKAWTEFNKTR
jgi:hypothetical protein